MFLDPLQRQSPFQQQLTQIRRIPLHCSSQRSAPQRRLRGQGIPASTPSAMASARPLPRAARTSLATDHGLSLGTGSRQGKPLAGRRAAQPCSSKQALPPTSTHPRSPRALHPKQKLSPLSTARDQEGGGG